MSAVLAAAWDLLMRVMRGLVIALAFLCVGSLIQAALIIGYLVVSGEINQPVGISPSFAWRSLAIIVFFAGPTGLIAGVWEMLFGRIRARAAFVISSLVASAHLVLVLLIYRPALPGGNDTRALWSFLGFETAAVLFLSFLAGMMACWKLIDIVRGKTPAVAVAQLFD